MDDQAVSKEMAQAPSITTIHLDEAYDLTRPNRDAIELVQRLTAGSQGPGRANDDELRALLGPAFDETTNEQRAQVIAACASIGGLYNSGDGLAVDATAGALAVILGNDTLDEIAAHWQAARAAEKRAHAQLRGAILATAGSERDVAARAGVARDTVRKARGK